MAADPAGNWAITGAYKGQMDFGTGPLVSGTGGTIGSLFVVEYDANGTATWAKSMDLGTTFNGEPKLPYSTDGDWVVASTLTGTIQIDGTTHQSASASDQDVLVFKLEGASGAARWARVFGGTSVELVGDAAKAPDGSTLVAASTWSSTVDVGTGTLVNSGAGSLLLVSLRP